MATDPRSVVLVRNRRKNRAITDAKPPMSPIRSDRDHPAASDAHGAWRQRRLIAAGFDAQLATQLAGDALVDLHELLVLRDRGCPPELAARILAPLDVAESR
jgi:hypothetical protein